MIPQCETDMISQVNYNEMQTFCQQNVKKYIMRQYINGCTQKVKIISENITEHCGKTKFSMLSEKVSSVRICRNTYVYKGRENILPVLDLKEE